MPTTVLAHELAQNKLQQFPLLPAAQGIWATRRTAWHAGGKRFESAWRHPPDSWHSKEFCAAPGLALSIDPDRQANLQRQAFTGANTSAEALAGVRGGRVLAPCLRGGPSPLPGPAGTPWPVGVPGTAVLAASH